MRRARIALLALVALLFGGCATPNVSNDYQLSEASGEGLVIGSVTYNGSLSAYKIFYRQLPTGESGFFKAGSAQIPPFPRNDFSGTGTGIVGELFSAKLPAGRYEFFTWGIASGVAETQTTEPFSIEFMVTAGKPVYLGNFHFLTNRNLGLTIAGANVYHRQHSAQDLALFKQKYPHLAQQTVAMSLPADMPDQRIGRNYSTVIRLPY